MLESQLAQGSVPDQDGVRVGRKDVELVIRDRERLREEKARLQRQVSELREDFAGAKSLHDRLLRDSQKREQEQILALRRLRAELNSEERASARLRTEQERLQAQLEETRALGRDVNSLQKSLKEETEKNRRLEATLEDMRKEVETLRETVATLQGEREPVDGEEGPAMAGADDLLKAEIESMRQELEEAKDELKRLREMGDGDLQARHEKHRAENERLRDRLATNADSEAPLRATVIRGADRGANGDRDIPEDLPEEAVPLVRGLRGAADRNLTVRRRNELLRSQDLGEFITRIRFGQNSVRIDPEEEAKLKNALRELPGGSFVLVVGYASTPGCSRHNAALSRRRAEAVVAIAKQVLPKGARLRSVSLGETDQFDPEREEENRVVEVWRVDS